MARTILTINDFYTGASTLRRHFEGRFKAPRDPDGGRFVWDWWHVPNQYTLLRTPAYEFFPKEIYDPLHLRLIDWSRRNLGCHDISPPWMSCYVEGCSQELHCDMPHGPFAYVYSLTQWKTRAFRGGETFLLRDEVMELWKGLPSRPQYESKELTQEIPPLFNRLTVFDPRVPHGVRRVSGASDVLDGRLVVHGWFTEPRPWIDGPVPQKSLKNAMEGLMEQLHSVMESGLDVSGMLTVQVHVSAAGAVTRTVFSADTMRGCTDQESTQLKKLIAAYFRSGRFGKQKAPSTLIIPLLFERA